MNKKDIKIFELTYHFLHSIEKVWIIFKNISIISLIHECNYHPIIIKGNDFSKQDCEFIGVFSEKFPYNGKVLKVLDLPFLKKIKFQFIFPNESILLIVKFEFHKLTEDNSTITLIKIKRNKNFLESISEIKKENIEKGLDKINNILNKNTVDLIQYESEIFSCSIEDLWNSITYHNNIKKIVPFIDFNDEESYKEIKEGDNFTYFFNNHNQMISFKVLLMKKNENWNKWIYLLEIIGGEPKIPKQKVYFELNKINNSECQFVFLNIFDEHLNNDFLLCLNEEKKLIIKCVKDYVEKSHC